VFLPPDAPRLLSVAGLAPPKSTYKSFSVMGRAFDPMKPQDYVDGFAIKRA
jgi:nitrate/nitrite transport system substrate-binding protein